MNVPIDIVRTVNKVIDSAWSHYNKEYSIALRINHSPRTRANIMSDLMIMYTRKFFEGKRGVVLRKNRGLFLLEIKGELLIRFKKLGRNQKASNIPTQQSIDFYGQQLDLPGISSRAVGLVAGYVLNGLQNGLESKLITCPKGSYVEWSIDMEEELTKQQADPIEIKRGKVFEPKRVFGKRSEINKRGMQIDEVS